MSTDLARRVGRIISASFNALVEKFEDASPERVMAEALDDIKGAMAEIRSDLGQVLAARHLAHKELAEKNKDHASLAEKVQIALAQDRDDLAEAGISAQLDIEAQIPILEQTISECSVQEKEYEGYLSALQAKKREVAAALERYHDLSNRSSEEDGGDHDQGKIGKNVDQALCAVERVMAKQTGGRSLKTASSQNADQIAELEQLMREHRIQERLIAMKSGKSGKSGKPGKFGAEDQ